jgi:hypothetical protein
MMQRQEAVACAAAMIALLGAAVRIARVDEQAVPRVAQRFTTSRGALAVGDDSLGQAAANTVENDPFRLVNHPTGVRYDAKTEGGIGGPPPAPPPVRPAFVLKAIVGGPPWQAVVDGIPGQPTGTIVRRGDSFDKLMVRSVGRDTVVIAAPDTTWKLTLATGRP